MRILRHYFGVLIGFALCAVNACVAGESNAAGIEFFEKRIRPVLVERCYGCHSAEAQKTGKLKAGLLLDSRDDLRKGGESGPAIQPGDAMNSLLVSAIRHASLKMPPAEKLPDQVIADFVAWIAMGAPDPRDEIRSKQAAVNLDGPKAKDFWSLAPLKSSLPPQLRNDSWARTPVDAFIAKRLEAAGISPNEIADRQILIRRLSFDLRGLPPGPEEVEAFLSDTAPDAYSRLVDRFLDSPNFGERWARHWLDLARFMESNGNAHDEDRRGAYHFRDFVIRAFNDDIPFDEFVRLQIAGDIINPGDASAYAATGFLAAGPYVTEQTIKERERSRYDQFDDMISTIGTGMLGLTVGCARCHDHKYDPISSDEYYRMVACFATTGFDHVSFDMDPDAYRQAKQAFDITHQPFIDRRVQYERESLSSKLAGWEQSVDRPKSPQWVVLEPNAFSTKAGAEYRRLLDGSLLLEGKTIEKDIYEFSCMTELTGIRAFRIEAIPDPSLPGGGPGRAADGRFELSDLIVTAKANSDPGDLPLVQLWNVRGNGLPDEATASALIDSNSNRGWVVNQNLDKTHIVAVTTEKELGHEGGTTIKISLRFFGPLSHSIGRFRLSVFANPSSRATGATANTIRVDANAATTAVFQGLQQKPAERSAETSQAILHWFGQSDAGWSERYAVEEEHFFRRPRQPLAAVFGARNFGTTYFLPDAYKVFFLDRGESDRKRGLALPGFLNVMMTEPAKPELWTINTRTNPPINRQPRVAFAGWMTDAERGAGRLLARVIVNRLWQHHLGRGIVATPSDFGSRGERPTHPELLDYLASELIRGGWQLKPIHKLILTSAVYMQRGELTSSALEKDPENRLFWRRTPKRLEAEVIRDSMLAAGGHLDQRMAGPGTLDEAAARRSIYLTIKHSKPVPLMQIFDAPHAINSVGARSNTAGAPQALAMMNSQTVRTFAEGFARRILSEEKSHVERAVVDAWRIAFSRPPSDDERMKMRRLIDELAETYGSMPGAKVQAIADFCQMIFCSNEFIYVD